MAAAGDDLQIGQKRSVVEGGGHLADAAAYLRGGGAGAEGTGGLVTPLLGAFTQNFVVVEGVTGHQHIIVDSFAGQLQVGVAVVVIGVGSLHSSQLIPEELLLQILAQDLGNDILHRNLQSLTVGCFAQKLLGSLQIEGIAVDLHGHLKGIHVHRGIHSFGVEHIVDLCQIQDLRRQLLIGHFSLDLKYVHAVGIQHIVVDILDIHVPTGTAGLQNQDLGLRFFVEFIAVQFGHIALQLPGGFFKDAVEASAVFIQNLTNVVGVQIQIGEQSNGVVACERISLSLFVLLLGAGTAIVVSCLHGSSYIQLGTGILGREFQNGIGKIYDHVFHGIGHVGSPVDGSGGFLGSHAAHIDAGYGHIVQNQSVILVGIQEHDHAQNDGCYQQHRYAGQGNPQDFPGFGLLTGGFLLALAELLLVIVIIFRKLLRNNGFFSVVYGGLLDKFRFLEGHGILRGGSRDRGLLILDRLKGTGHQHGFIHGSVPDRLEEAGYQHGLFHGGVTQGFLNGLLNGRNIFRNVTVTLLGLPGLGKFTFGYGNHLLYKRWDILADTDIY